MPFDLDVQVCSNMLAYEFASEVYNGLEKENINILIKGLFFPMFFYIK